MIFDRMFHLAHWKRGTFPPAHRGYCRTNTVAHGNSRRSSTILENSTLGVIDPSTRLFLAQSHHGVNFSRSPGWYHGGGECHNGQQGGFREECRGIGRGHAEQQTGDFNITVESGEHFVIVIPGIVGEDQVSTWSAVNPGGALCERMKLRINNPAPMSRTNEMASSETMSNTDSICCSLIFRISNEEAREVTGGERGIRTPDRAFDPITV